MVLKPACLFCQDGGDRWRRWRDRGRKRGNEVNTRYDGRGEQGRWREGEEERENERSEVRNGLEIADTVQGENLTGNERRTLIKL